MRSLEELSKKARELKEKGLSTYEIADELKVQADTVVWLLLHQKEVPKSKDKYDVYVNWNPIGASVLRMGETIRAAMETLEAAKAKPVGVAVLANKSGKESIEGIPLRSLVELLPVARQ